MGIFGIWSEQASFHPLISKAAKADIFSSPKVMHTDNLHKSYNATACECDAEARRCVYEKIRARTTICMRKCMVYVP